MIPVAGLDTEYLIPTAMPPPQFPGPDTVRAHGLDAIHECPQWCAVRR